MGLSKTLRSRGIKTLYIIVLKYMSTGDCNSGICTAIVEIKDLGWISLIEKDRLNCDLMNRKPAGKSNSEFWFNSKEERITFLENIINSL